MREEILDSENLTIDFAQRRPAIRSKRAASVARVFGVPVRAEIPATQSFEGPAMQWLDSLVPAPGSIVLITGPSGAGKSSLLRAIRNASNGNSRRWIDLSKLHPPNRPVVDCFGKIALVRVLEMLSRVGLAEVWTYLRTPGELSDGQFWRLRLALALLKAKQSAHSILACDEFAALLDRVSAAVVARTLRRAICDSRNASAIVATSHDDLLRALSPDVIVRCDFGKISVEKN